MAQTKRAGRPTTAATDEKVTLSIRATPSLKERLLAAAEKHDQSLSQEAEKRLEDSFHEEGQHILTLDTLRAPQLAALVSLLFVVMKDVGEKASVHSYWKNQSPPGRDATGTPYDWLADPYCYDQMTQAVMAVLDAFRPKGDPENLHVGKPVTHRFRKELGRDVAYATVARVQVADELPDSTPLALTIHARLDELVHRIELPERYRRICAGEEGSAGEKSK